MPAGVLAGQETSGGPQLTDLTTTVTWVDVRERLPRAGQPVAAAITGRYPFESPGSDAAPGEAYWLVMTMHFADWHETEDGAAHHDCFVDSDRIVRFPYSPDSGEGVTHWAALPALPGQVTRFLDGDDVRPALRHVQSCASSPMRRARSSPSARRTPADAPRPHASPAHTAYGDSGGSTEEPDGYRLVLSTRDWSNTLS